MQPDRIPDPANPANLINQTPFAFSFKSLKRLKAASELIIYYESVSIELTAAEIRWPVIENYEIQRKAISLRIKQTVPDVPKIGKTTTVVKWNDSLIVYAGQVFGARKSSLKYVIRSNGGGCYVPSHSCTKPTILNSDGVCCRGSSPPTFTQSSSLQR